jgi:hypothetical protein
MNRSKPEEQKSLIPVKQPEYSTSLAFYDRFQNPMEAVTQFGTMLASSGMFGKLTAPQGNVLAWHLFTKRKDPFEFLREYHILETGKITKRADAMAAEFKERGGKIVLISDLMDAKEAKAKFIKDGQEYTWSFKIEDARGWSTGSNGFLKTNWANSTPDMLRARLFSKAIRILDPAINTGLYTPEELTDGADKADIPIQPAQSLFGRAEEPQGSPAIAPVITEVTETKPATATPAQAPTEKPQNGGSAPFLWEKKQTGQEPESQAPTVPHGKTVAEMRIELQSRLEKFNSTLIDTYFVKEKKWLGPGEAFPDLPDERIKYIYERYDLFVSAFKAWEKKRSAEKPVVAK